MNNLPDINKINIEISEIENDLIEQKKISVSILRLDKIHPEISGNKIFKLHYFLEDAIKSSHKKIITFGGAYSNHLAAVAFAGNQLKINTTGIVRGEKPSNLSHTLIYCQQQGMQLEFINRENYLKKGDDEFKNDLINKYGDHVLIPEGGFNEKGLKGAALIADFYKNKNFTHVCCAVGSATTIAGLIQASAANQKIIGFSALKNMNDFDKRIEFLLKEHSEKKYFCINDYHFGGFAKKNDELIYFMNNFYNEFKIPTDFVYTAKMIFGVFDLIKKNYFPAGSKILCIHTGGLQGNDSLPKNTFNF